MTQQQESIAVFGSWASSSLIKQVFTRTRRRLHGRFHRAQDRIGLNDLMRCAVSGSMVAYRRERVEDFDGFRMFYRPEASTLVGQAATWNLHGRDFQRSNSRDLLGSLTGRCWESTAETFVFTQTWARRSRALPTA